MPNDYVGRYGEALRKLRALDRAPSTEIAGAFGRELPQQSPGAFQPQQAAPQPRPAFAQPGLDMFDPEKPVSAAELYKQMPDDAKEAMAEQLKAQGIDVDTAYEREVQAGNIVAQKKPPSRNEKMGYLAEVALRTISNLGRQGTTSSADWADAVLATDARRDGLAERERQETRQDTKEQTAFQRAQEAEARARAERLAEREADRTARKSERDEDRTTRSKERDEDRAFTREENARARAAAAADRKAGRQPRTITATDGGVYTLNDDGTATPVTTEREVDETVRAPGGGGSKGPRKIKKKVREQLRAPARSNDASGVDKDTLIRSINERFKLLREDRKNRTKTDSELQAIAEEQVMSQLGKINGESAPARQSNAFDIFD